MSDSASADGGQNTRTTPSARKVTQCEEEERKKEKQLIEATTISLQLNGQRAHITRTNNQILALFCPLQYYKQKNLNQKVYH